MANIGMGAHEVPLPYQPSSVGKSLRNSGASPSAYSTALFWSADASGASPEDSFLSLSALNSWATAFVIVIRIAYAVEHPKEGEVYGVNPPVWFDGARPGSIAPPPALGEHTDDVLTELGLSDEEISRLRGDRVI